MGLRKSSRSTSPGWTGESLLRFSHQSFLVKPAIAFKGDVIRSEACSRKSATHMMATSRIRSITLLVTSAMLSIGAAQRPAEQSPPSLIVTPSRSIAFSGPPGGPFSPSLIEYRVSASTGTVSYSIRTPSWLTASSTFGVTDTKGVTITLTVNASASRLPPGAYGPGVAFTNVSNGQGSATKPAKLIIQASSLPPPPKAQIAPSRGGYLLDSRGGYLLDDRGGRLMAQ